MCNWIFIKLIEPLRYVRHEFQVLVIQESGLQLAYYIYPRDAYEVRVEVAREVATPRPVAFCLARAQSSTFAGEGTTRVAATRPLCIPAVGEDATTWRLEGGRDDLAAQGRDDLAARGRDGTTDDELGADIDVDRQSSVAEDVGDVGSQLVAWGVDRGRANELQAIVVPEPIVGLILRGAWAYLVLLIRWHNPLNIEDSHQHRREVLPGPIPEWPPHDAVVWRHNGKDRDINEDNSTVMEKLDSDTCLALLRKLHGWAPLAAGSRDVLAQMASAATTLRTWAQGFSDVKGIGSPGYSGRMGRYRHTAAKLLKAVRLSFMVRGGASQLHDVTARSLALALPTHLQAAFLEGKGEHQKVYKSICPSATLVRRAEMSLDVAIMLISRSRFTDKCVRFAMTDSSPIGGYDWLWSTFHEIHEDKLVSCFEALTALQTSIQDFATGLVDDDDDDEELDWHSRCEVLPEWQPWLDTLRDNIRLHINPPAALASGHSALSDKVAAEAHKMHLQTPQGVSLCAVTRLYGSHTGDMGVELGIPTFVLAAGPDSILPTWHERMPLHPDVDAHIDGDIGEGDASGPPDSPFASSCSGTLWPTKSTRIPVCSSCPRR